MILTLQATFRAETFEWMTLNANISYDEYDTNPRSDS